VFPQHLLRLGESGLCLFAAGFLGKQDAYWMANAGMDATCVDTDAEKLAVMKQLYPRDWEFVVADVFDFAAAADRQWDVVSLDPFTNLYDQVGDLVDRWCALARRGVVMGCGRRQAIRAPVGWRVSEMVRRSAFHGGTYWAVLEPR